ncbi:hypothetical protein FOZ63_008227, partial [Perkinsus olseni]
MIVFLISLGAVSLGQVANPWSADYLSCEHAHIASKYVSNSQWFQDWFVYHNFFPWKRNLTFMDIGAFHPFMYSNSLMFERCFGWRGVCVEPNPTSGRGHIVDSLADGEAHAVESNFSMLPCKLADD